MVLEATVRLVADEPHRLLLVLGYPSMAEAADAVPALLAAGGGRLVACEGLDARIVDLVKARGSAVPELPPGAGWLFVEVAGADPAELRDLAGRLAAAVRRPRPPAGRRTSPRRRRCGGSARTAPAWPPAAWRRRRTPAGRTPPSRPSGSAPGCATSTSCSASTVSTGCPTATSATAACTCASTSRSSPGRTRRRKVFRDFLTACALKLRDHRGSLSGEHGDGRARSELLPLMYDAESLRLFAAAKAICDPDNLLNPGNLVDPAPLDADLRPVRPRLPVTPLLRLPHDGGSLGDAVHRCTGVGKCVAPATTGVMCPSYLATRDEKDSTRGRARVLQEAIDGSLVQRLRRPGGRRGARPLPGLQGLRVRLPDRRGHGDVQGRGAAPEARRRGRTPAAQPPAARPAADVGGPGRADGAGWPTG